MTKYVLLLLLLLVSAPVSAQPSLKWPLTAYVAGVTADYASTQQVLAHGGIETNPLYHWSEASGGFPAILGLSIAADAGTAWVIGHVVGAHHPRLARTALIGLGVFRAGLAAKNFRLAYQLDHPSPLPIVVTSYLPHP